MTFEINALELTNSGSYEHTADLDRFQYDIRVYEEKTVKGDWYIVYDGKVVTKRKKDGLDWKPDAKTYIEGFVDGLNSK